MVMLLAAPTTAMFGGKGSAVKEVTPKNINSFLKTHKPVMLLVYAPWCGHCKAIHGDWEKLARSLDGIVKVGAADADAHKDIGQRFQVKGFPTIKAFGMTSDKKGNKTPMDYQQERSFSAMKKYATGLVSNKGVQSIKKLDASVPHVILFTQKASVPPMFSVVALSPTLKEKYSFFVAKEKVDKKAIEAYEVPSYPSIAVIEKADGEEEPTTKWLEFTKGMKYNDVAEFINGGKQEKKKKE